MKTFQQFQLDSQQFDENYYKLAGDTTYRAYKFLKKTPILKTAVRKVGKFFAKKPVRNIDPYFANKAFEKGKMVPGYHGQSTRKITQYKKTGVTPTVSGVRTDPLEQYKSNPATIEWIKRTGYTGGETNKKMARRGIDAYYTDKTPAGKRQANIYARRGAAYENDKLKNVLNPIKDKGEVMDVAVNKRSVRKGWKNLKNPGTESERIAKAKDIIPVVDQPSKKVGKYRLTQQIRKDRKLSNDKRKIVGSSVQEGKGDAIQAAKMLGKKLKDVSPELLGKTKEFLRNQRSGLSTKVRRGQKNLKAIEKTDKYSKLATDRKSIHPPTADAAQAKFTDRKVELIKNKNNRRRAKERILRRMFNMGEK